MFNHKANYGLIKFYKYENNNIYCIWKVLSVGLSFIIEDFVILKISVEKYICEGNMKLASLHRWQCLKNK